ncbi:MAG: antitoxin VapB family protein [Nanoarchaeota archaeon]
MVTTIQIGEDVKSELEKLKTNKETYEEVIVNLMKFAEQQKRREQKLLIEGYKEMASETLAVNKEWETADKSWD